MKGTRVSKRLSADPARLAAMAVGQTRFLGDHACGAGHTPFWRYVASGDCCACARERVKHTRRQGRYRDDKTTPENALAEERAVDRRHFADALVIASPIPEKAAPLRTGNLPIGIAGAAASTAKRRIAAETPSCYVLSAGARSAKTRLARAALAHADLVSSEPPKWVSMPIGPASTCRFIDRKDAAEAVWRGVPEAEIYCCKPTREGSSYCPEHHALVWVKPATKPRVEPTSQALAWSRGASKIVPAEFDAAPEKATHQQRA